MRPKSKSTTWQRKTALRLRRQGISARKIAPVIRASASSVGNWTRDEADLPPVRMGRPRKFDHDEAIRLLQYPFWTPQRIALKMGVTKQAIYRMIDRMLESTVEEGGQI